MKTSAFRFLCWTASALAMVSLFSPLLVFTGCGGANASSSTPVTSLAVTITANPASIAAGSSSMLTVAVSHATAVTVSGSDGSSYQLSGSGGTQAVTPSASTTYMATATGAGVSVSAVAKVTVTAPPPPPPQAVTITITASPASITAGASSTLAVLATNAIAVTVSGSDGTSYKLSATGGTQSVSPAATTTYTAEAVSVSGNASATATVTVTPQTVSHSINHVIFMLQENHTFDNYFGMLNPYRRASGWNVGDDGNVYTVDGIDDKLTLSNQTDEGTSIPPYKFKSTCIEDATSDWLGSYGDVNRYNFSAGRPIRMDGFVHNAEGYAKNCALSGLCAGSFTDTAGKRAMGYYDQSFLNYYYYLASQFAVSDRWFSPMSSKSTPNRIATFTGGTTRGLVYDPGYDDHVGALGIPTIFDKLDSAGVSWKLYYTQTASACTDGDACGGGSGSFPATTLGYLTSSRTYLYENPTHAACTGVTRPSSVIGDTSNSFCIDPNHIAPLATYFTDLTNGKLASFTFIESGSVNDEHPGSGQSILYGQAAVAKIVNAFMSSPAWKDSVFFFSYDEGGGPYDHVPPVPGHSNDKTDAALGSIPDISTIAVNPDSFKPCVPSTGTATAHCDLRADSPGANPGDAAAVKGFAAQLGFRVPNIVISPFTRRHYVSHIPMDHTAVIKFVEDRFIGGSAHITAHDAAQPNLMDFFDFSRVPWATPPTPPAPATAQTLGYDPCTPTNLGP
jgi:phospholipase C